MQDLYQDLFLKQILDSNTLKATIPDDVLSFSEEYEDKDHFERVSFTRDYRMGFLERSYIRITLDRNLLSNKYKIRKDF